MDEKIRIYKKEFPYSYVFGASPALNLLQCAPQLCLSVIYSEDYRPKGTLLSDLCEKHGIEYIKNTKLINILSPKENCYVIGIFKKTEYNLSSEENHILLDNPADMGNLGTIIRTAAGFGVKEIALAGNAADIYNPKTIRASMGAFFHVKFERFNDYSAYESKYGRHRTPYAFMLGGAETLENISHKNNDPFTLIFGNESAGLGDEYKKIGRSVRIRHNSEIDSLSLPAAASIALFWFTRKSSDL